MKLLIDTCVPESVFEKLLDGGYDADWTGDWDEDPGDREILEVAYIQGRVLVTLDKDFGELAVRLGLPHHGIILLRKLRISEQATACLEALEQFADELQQGAIVVAERDKMRCRLADPVPSTTR